MSDSERKKRKSRVSSHFPKPSSRMASSSVSANAETVENRRVSFADVSETVSADAAMSPLPLSFQNFPISEESDFFPQLPRHPSLITKFGALNVFKASSGKLAPHWCSLSAAKFRIFARNNQSDMKQSIECGDIERVEDVLDSQDMVLHPIVLTFLKSKHRQKPITLSATSAQEQQEWIAVMSRRNTHALYIA